MNEKHLDLVHRLLDCQLLDANYVECGKVEDVELKGGAGKLEVTALITGPGAAAERAPGLLRPLVRKLLGSRVTRVPWGEVLVITGGQIKLKSRADQLGLAAEESRVARRLENIPGAK
jgi:hypothetical protein